MFKWVRANLGIKLLSLFTAVLLWFHVVTERMYEKAVTIPIQCVNLGKGLVVTKPPPESVEVRIRGRGKELLRFGKSGKVVLNLDEMGLGWQRIDLEKENVNLPPGSKISVVSGPTPRGFVILVQETVQKTVRVQPSLDSTYDFEVIPNTIEISGIKSVVNPVSRVLTEGLAPPNILPKTLRVKLIIPEGIQAFIDSVTVIVKSP
jgi:YbbR domain-containing protein